MYKINETSHISVWFVGYQNPWHKWHLSNCPYLYCLMLWILNVWHIKYTLYLSASMKLSLVVYPANSVWTKCAINCMVVLVIRPFLWWYHVVSCGFMAFPVLVFFKVEWKHWKSRLLKPFSLRVAYWRHLFCFILIQTTRANLENWFRKLNYVSDLIQHQIEYCWWPFTTY